MDSFCNWSPEIWTTMACRKFIRTRDNTIFDSPYYKDSRLVAYRTNGSVARSWRLLGANGNQPAGLGTVAFGDFDGDGKVELAVNYQLISGGGISGHLHE